MRLQKNKPPSVGDQGTTKLFVQVLFARLFYLADFLSPKDVLKRRVELFCPGCVWTTRVVSGSKSFTIGVAMGNEN